MYPTQNVKKRRGVAQKATIQFFLLFAKRRIPKSGRRSQTMNACGDPMSVCARGGSAIKEEKSKRAKRLALIRPASSNAILNTCHHAAVSAWPLANTRRKNMWRRKARSKNPTPPAIPAYPLANESILFWINHGYKRDTNKRETHVAIKRKVS